MAGLATSVGGAPRIVVIVGGDLLTFLDVIAQLLAQFLTVARVFVGQGHTGFISLDGRMGCAGGFHGLRAAHVDRFGAGALGNLGDTLQGIRHIG